MATDTSGENIRLIICVDGTGDTSDGSYDALRGVVTGTRSSIGTINHMIAKGTFERTVEVNGKTETKRFKQVTRYLEGVGTKKLAFGTERLSRMNSSFQAVTGDGYLNILRDGYKACCMELNSSDDEIFLFGFSRGAFIVRALASFLQHVGLIKREEMHGEIDFEAKFKRLLWRYEIVKNLAKYCYQSDHPAESSLASYCKRSPRIRFIGAFDTVQYVIQLPLRNVIQHGVPIVKFGMDAPHIVDNFRHALALNEGRPPFEPSLWETEAKSPHSKYLEAWFLGFHHDIGGGNQRQGLALWPLQWILQGAEECGLMFDRELTSWKLLFTGTKHLMHTPHEPSLQMYDMIDYHMGEQYRLHLNVTSWGLLDKPRDYLRRLTVPPYNRHTRPKVYVHPSAYLAFDVSSSFRMQLAEWKYFHRFLKNRHETIPAHTVPWWEEKTLKAVLRADRPAVERMNLLVYGPPGVGKAALVKKSFGWFSKGLGGEATDINTPVLIPGNDLINLHYSDGIGNLGSNAEQVEQFLTKYGSAQDPKDQLHAIWYCVDCSLLDINHTQKATHDLEQQKAAEDKRVKMLFQNIPVIVVFMKRRALKKKIRREIFLGWFRPVGVRIRLEKTIERKKLVLAALGARNFVEVGRNPAKVRKLLAETQRDLKDDVLQSAQIRSQRLSVKPKVALAVEETVRAYGIWHMFKADEKKIAFYHSELGADGKPARLCQILMEPVLDSFNMRFPGDVTLIQSMIGKAWAGLDEFKDGIHDAKIPGDLILLCMMDTTIVLNRAFRYQQIHDRIVSQMVRPLNASDVYAACIWYASPGKGHQEAIHTRIRNMLYEPEFSPKVKSVGRLQMKLVETVEIGSEAVEESFLRFWTRPIALIKATFNSKWFWLICLIASGLSYYFLLREPFLIMLCGKPKRCWWWSTVLRF